MKLIIAGSRSVHATIPEIMELITYFKLIPTEIVSGTAYGIDKCGEAWAEACNIPIKRFPAQWDLYGKPAGMMRNRQMGQYADALLLIWDGKSKGSAGMKEFMRVAGKPIYEAVVK